MIKTITITTPALSATGFQGRLRVQRLQLLRAAMPGVECRSLKDRGSSADVVRDGLEEIFPRIWRYCLALTGSRFRADDLVQAAYLRALEKANLFKAGTNFDRWMFTLIQRLWINELRKDAVRTGGGLSTLEDANLVDAKPDPEMNSIGREVLMAVMELPEAQRATVALVYAEGYSYRDAAEILDIPVGTVMSRLAVAREKLVQKFSDEGVRK